MHVVAGRALIACLAVLWLAAAAPPQPRTHYAVIDRIAGPDGGWDYASIDAAARRLYLARDPGVLSMNLDTRTITALAVAGQGVHGAAIVGDSGLVVATNGDADSVTIFEGATARVVATVKVGKSPDAVTYDPSTRLVAVINHDAGTVSLLDAARARVVRTIRVGGELEAAAPSGDGRLFVNIASQHAVAVVDLVAGKVLHRFRMKGCTDPSGLVYEPTGARVASVCGNGVTKILRASDGAEVASLATGSGSDGLILDVRRRLLFVPAGKEGTLSVIALGTGGAPTLVQSLKTTPGVRLGALDEKTGRLYLPSARFGPPVPPHPWPSVVPGTFAFLVVGEQ
jgi:YVTN family beta-propeller protein